MGDTRERLEVLRDRLDAQIAVADDRSLPGLAREYRATLAALDALGQVGGNSKLDELRLRRDARPAETADQPRSVGS